MDTSRLQREIYPMPEDVLLRLSQNGLLDAYHSRPPYQQNDYIGWITRARRPETREKRLRQMLSELAAGGVYMNMAWRGK